MKAILLLMTCAVLNATSSFAQTTTTAPATPTTTSTTSAETKKSSLLDSVVLGYKSSNETGRFGFKDEAVSKDAFTGRVYKGKHEIKLGYKHTSGWGAYGQMTQNRYDYKDSLNNNNKWALSDPSITINHPAFYTGDQLKVTGSARYYIPTTDRSKKFNVRQYSYYLDASYSLGGGAEIFNEINPRYFDQNSYGLTDTKYKIEDITTYSQKIANWGRWGVGQWTQYEVHPNSPNGITTDVYPFFDYLITSKIFVGPRVYMPVYVKEAVYDGSRNVTFDNAYLQLYVQASL